VNGGGGGDAGLGVRPRLLLLVPPWRPSWRPPMGLVNVEGVRGVLAWVTAEATLAVGVSSDVVRVVPAVTAVLPVGVEGAVARVVPGR